jgi:hypothetical protein
MKKGTGMSIRHVCEADTRQVRVLSRVAEHCPSPRDQTPDREDAFPRQELHQGSPPPELFSRRIDAKRMVVSHLDIFLEVAKEYLQEYGTTHNFGSELHRCLEALESTRVRLQVE